MDIVESRWTFMSRPIHGMVAMLHPLYKTPALFMDTSLSTLQTNYINKVFSEEQQLAIDAEFASYMNSLGPSFVRAVATREEATKFPLTWWQIHGRIGLPKLCRLALRILSQILEKGELQVSGRERDVHLSSQFRDIATIVMQKTVNSQTQRPYTISMIERLMREVHFALEPNQSSKKQALELIKELEKQFPIVRAKMRLQLLVPSDQGSQLTQKLNEWNSLIEQTDGSSNIFKVVCQIDPGHFRECDAFVRDSSGKLEVMAMSVQKEGDGNVNDLEDSSTLNPSSSNQSNLSKDFKSIADKKEIFGPLDQEDLSTSVKTLSLERGPVTASSGKEKQRRCTTCNAEVGDASQHREHFKSDWHKHNLKRKVKQLPPLSAQDWHLDKEILEEVNDLNEYSR
ncbi:hypothetical protein L7F22_061451 [Adiantum nelumboides]|nr:hypothetical protein [Adiantum nelumboides]